MSDWRERAKPINQTSDWRQRAQPMDVKDPNFFERVKSDYQSRMAEGEKIKEMKRTGQIGPLMQAYGITGKVGAGLVGDVSGQGITELARGIDYITPQSVDEYVGQTGRNIAASPLGQFVGNASKNIAQAYGQFKQENPVAALGVESTANIAGLGVPTASRGQNILKTGQNLGRAVKQKFMPIEKMTSEDIRKVGGDLFKQAEQVGGVARPDFTDSFLDEISGLARQTEAGKIFAGESPVEGLIQRAQSLRGKPLSFDALKEIDEELGNLAYSELKEGKFSKDGQAFLEMQSKLRNKIEEATPDNFVGGKEAFETAKEARKYWSASLKLRDIERIIERAKDMQVPATAIKTGFRTLKNNPNRMKGFTKAEKDAIAKAAQTGIATDILNVMGSRLSPIAVGAGGFAAGGPLAGVASSAAQYAISGLSRSAAEAMQFGKASKVEDLIRQRLVEAGVEQVRITPQVINALKEMAIVSAPLGGVSATQDQLQKPDLSDILKMPPQEAMKYLEAR